MRAVASLKKRVPREPSPPPDQRAAPRPAWLPAWLQRDAFDAPRGASVGWRLLAALALAMLLLWSVQRRAVAPPQRHPPAPPPPPLALAVQALAGALTGVTPPKPAAGEATHGVSSVLGAACVVALTALLLAPSERRATGAASALRTPKRPSGRRMGSLLRAKREDSGSQEEGAPLSLRRSKSVGQPHLSPRKSPMARGMSQGMRLSAGGEPPLQPLPPSLHPQGSASAAESLDVRLGSSSLSPEGSLLLHRPKSTGAVLMGDSETHPLSMTLPDHHTHAPPPPHVERPWRNRRRLSR